MTYQALARKWRPRRFSELVGQEHVVQALTHALAANKLHHALLFSGTRGVGKTTLGRIVAKCLNCETGPTAEPCVDTPCSACAEIDEGRFIDLIEVDAASRTGVDDTRELMDNVQYAPTRGRRKVYLIDEVHMLSKHAFNALLKTLEEPPPHVQFLLATTDPQKIPVTILSRCLQFPLKRLPVRDIAGQLEHIVQVEGIAAQAEAIAAIARAADGSMRDGLSLLDQAVAFGGGQLTAAQAHELLGSVGADAVHAVLAAVAAGDAPAMLDALARVDEQAPDYENMHEALAAALHRIAVLQLVPAAAGDEEGALGELAARMDPAEVQLDYDIALAGRRDLDWAPDPRSGLEMTCLRMLAFRPAGAAVTPAGKCDATESAPAAGRESAAESSPPAPEPAATALPSAGGDTDGSWDALVNQLGLRGMAAELARNCVCKSLEADAVVLQLPATLQHLNTVKARGQLEQALLNVLGESTGIEMALGDAQGQTPACLAGARDTARRDAAVQAITDDPNVRALQELLGAQLQPESIEPESKRGQGQTETR